MVSYLPGSSGYSRSGDNLSVLSPGSANAYPGCVQEVVWRDKRHIIYGCGEGIVVHVEGGGTHYEDVTRRPYSGRAEIRAVTMSTQSGLLASCDAEHVRIHLPNDKNTTVSEWPVSEWPVSAQAKQTGINCAAWGFQDLCHIRSRRYRERDVGLPGTLLTAGESVAMWDVEVTDATVHIQRRWEKKVPVPVAALIATECGILFATIGRSESLMLCFPNDGLACYAKSLGQASRLVKVWYGNGGRVPYHFSYLLHPRSVLNATWRDRSTPSLVTVCADGLSRIWLAQSPESFYITNVVDLNSLTICPVPAITSNPRLLQWTDCEEGQSLTLASKDLDSTTLIYQDVPIDAVVFQYIDNAEMIAWAIPGDESGNPQIHTAPLLIGKVQLDDRLKSIGRCIIHSANSTHDLGLSLVTPVGDIYRVCYGKLGNTAPRLLSVASGQRRAITNILVNGSFVATLAQDGTLMCFQMTEGNTHLMPTWRAADVYRASWIGESNILLAVEQGTVVTYSFECGQVARILFLPTELANIGTVTSACGTSLQPRTGTPAVMNTEHWAVAVIADGIAYCWIVAYDGVCISSVACSTPYHSATAISISRERSDPSDTNTPARARCVISTANGQVNTLTAMFDGKFDKEATINFFVENNVRESANTQLSVNEAGDIAIAYDSPGRTVIEIWSRSPLSKTWHRKFRHTFREEDNVLDIDWYPIQGTSTAILVISTRAGLFLVAASRFDQSPGSYTWRIVGTTTMAQQCSARLYGDGSKILLAESSKLQIVTNASERITWSFNGSTRPNNLAELAALLAAGLPLYHPRLLEFLVEIVDFDRLRQVVMLIEEAVHKGSQYSSFLGDDDKIHESLCPPRNMANATAISKDNCQYLIQDLEHFVLPGLTTAEQQRARQIIGYISQVIDWVRSMDEAGLRFALSIKLCGIGEATSSALNMTAAITYHEISWAYFSQSQDSLFTFCKTQCGVSMDWSMVSSLGIPLWLRDTSVLKELAIKMARDRFAASKDPTEATLFYIALRKKALLVSLWRTASFHEEKSKMVKFLTQDFSDPRWKSAACKNAFVLLGKQRYEMAASFFLLGDRLKDAVNVCLKHLQDVQLAICICRLYEGDDSPTLRDLFNRMINDDDVIDETAANGKADTIYWLRAMAYWALQDRVQAIDFLVDYVLNNGSETAKPSLVSLIDQLCTSHRLPVAEEAQQTLKAWLGVVERRAFGSVLA